MLGEVWNAHNVSLSMKLKIVNSLVISVLIYGCDSWKGLRENENRPKRFESGCLRMMISIICYDHVNEINLRNRTGQQSVVKVIKMLRWRWYRLLMRMPDSRLPNLDIGWTPTGRRNVGRLKVFFFR